MSGVHAPSVVAFVPFGMLMAKPKSCRLGLQILNLTILALGRSFLATVKKLSRCFSNCFVRFAKCAFNDLTCRLAFLGLSAGGSAGGLWLLWRCWRCWHSRHNANSRRQTNNERRYI